jgi:NAD(P)-dependent dehydrogenase (short-subunit alcohol dehydrogenase family)
MKTRFITGVSSGFGRAIANAVLSVGDRVVGTLRNREQRESFAALAPGRSFVWRRPGRNRRPEGPADRRPRRTRVRADRRLVNNAGYGHEGTFEESTLEDLRRQFNVNVFGAVAVTKPCCPI